MPRGFYDTNRWYIIRGMRPRNVKSAFFEKKLDNADDFEALYFFLLRTKLDAVGEVDGIEVFRISGGVEQKEERRAYLYADPKDWKRPPVEMVRGMIQQFSNIAALCRYMGMSRNTTTVWQKKGNLSYERWRILLELLGVARPLSGEGVRLRDHWGLITEQHDHKEDNGAFV